MSLNLKSSGDKKYSPFAGSAALTHTDLGLVPKLLDTKRQSRKPNVEE